MNKILKSWIFLIYSEVPEWYEDDEKETPKFRIEAPNLEIKQEPVSSWNGYNDHTPSPTNQPQVQTNGHSHSNGHYGGNTINKQVVPTPRENPFVWNPTPRNSV